MSSEVANLVAVLPDGREYFGDNVRYSFCSNNNFAEQAVFHFGIKSPRSNPIDIKVKIYRLDVKKGKLERTLYGSVDVRPCLEPMTQQEFDTEIESVVSEIPAEFHNFIKSYAWMEGHSSGFENVLCIASELVARLADPIKAYEKNIVASRKKASKK